MLVGAVVQEEAWAMLRIQLLHLILMRLVFIVVTADPLEDRQMRYMIVVEIFLLQI